MEEPKAGHFRPAFGSNQSYFFGGTIASLKALAGLNLYDGLCRDLNLFAGCWVPTFAGFPFDQYGFTDAWEHEGSFLLGFGDCQGCELLNHGCSSLRGNLKLPSEMGNDLSLC